MGQFAHGMHNSRVIKKIFGLGVAKALDGRLLSAHEIAYELVEAGVPDKVACEVTGPAGICGEPGGRAPGDLWPCLPGQDGERQYRFTLHHQVAGDEAGLTMTQEELEQGVGEALGQGTVVLIDPSGRVIASVSSESLCNHGLPIRG